MFLTQEQIERIRAAIAKDSEGWLKLTAVVNGACEKLVSGMQELADKYQAAYEKTTFEQAEFEQALAQLGVKAKDKAEMAGNMSDTLEDFTTGMQGFDQDFLDLSSRHAANVAALKDTILSYTKTFPVEVVAEYYELDAVQLETIRILATNRWYLLKLEYIHRFADSSDVTMHLVKDYSDLPKFVMENPLVSSVSLKDAFYDLERKGLLTQLKGGGWSGLTDDKASWDYTVYGLSELGKYLAGDSSQSV